MKASDLRLGNIVGVCYETPLVPEQVIVLEPDAVHLSNRKYPDSDRDIVGIPLSEKWLTDLKFRYNSAFEHWSNLHVIIWKIPDAARNFGRWTQKPGPGKFPMSMNSKICSMYSNS
jgi:hypothetical protein